MKTAVSNVFRSMFSCCNPEDVRERASFDDIKIDSEISEIVNDFKDDKMVPEKTVKCDAISLNESTSNNIKKCDAIKKNQSSSKNIEKCDAIKKDQSSATNIKKCDAIKKDQSSSKFHSPGMVKMTIARNKKYPNRNSKKDIQHNNDNTDEIISAYDELEQDKSNNKEMEAQYLEQDYTKNQLSEDKIVSLNNDPSVSKASSIIDTFINKNTNLSTNSNNPTSSKAIQNQDDSLMKPSIQKDSDEPYVPRTDKEDFSNYRPESSFKNPSLVDLDSRIKSMEQFLEQDSLDTESFVSEDEPEISCAIDFYDKREFNRMLLKKIQQSLKKERKDIRYRKDNSKNK